MTTKLNTAIQNKIYTVREQQVMLDRDLAVLYGVETRILNQAVKRNIERFPSEFMFQVTDNEINLMVSQFVIPSKQHLGGAKPYVFTEQGVAMLSGVLRSDTAVKMSIKIMNSFVQMRHFITQNTAIFTRLDTMEQKQLKTDTKLDQVLDALSQNQKPKQGIFYDGQVFDAYVFASDLIKSAKQKIILIDNFCDETTLLLLSKRNPKTQAVVYTKTISNQLKLDIEKYNKQYAKITFKKFDKSHDRFLIIDDEIYHLGASLKDLGKKWFAFSKMHNFNLLNRINRQ